MILKNSNYYRYIQSDQLKSINQKQIKKCPFFSASDDRRERNAPVVLCNAASRISDSKENEQTWFKRFLNPFVLVYPLTSQVSDLISHI